MQNFLTIKLDRMRNFEIETCFFRTKDGQDCDQLKQQRHRTIKKHKVQYQITKARATRPLFKQN